MMVAVPMALSWNRPARAVDAERFLVADVLATLSAKFMVSELGPSCAPMEHVLFYLTPLQKCV